jgi:hypothetical protein
MNKDGRVTLLDLKLCFKPAVIKIIYGKCIKTNKKSIEEIESLEPNPCN